MSRPQIVVRNHNGAVQAILIYRDIERNDKVSIAICNDINQQRWEVKDLTTTPVGLWEPSYDKEIWKNKQELHLFVERVEQGDGEKTNSIPAQDVQVLEWKP
jgi:hypothetical protein